MDHLQADTDTCQETLTLSTVIENRQCKDCLITFPKTREFFYYNKKTRFFSRCKNCWNIRSNIRTRKIKEDVRSQKIDPNSIKKCTDCDLEKSLTQFYVRGSNSDGRERRCRSCAAKIAYGRNTEKRVDEWIKILLNGTKNACRRLNREFNITAADVQELFEKQAGLCYWYNVPLVPSKQRRTSQKPSLDRLDNAKGYTKDNVVLACYAANFGRSTSSAEDFAKFVEVLRQSLVMK